MKNPDLNFSSSSSITIADLPPCGPYVSFENSIGESLKSDETIDFDESALYKTSGVIGLDSETLAKTAVTFCGKKSTAILGIEGVGGSASYEENGAIRVNCRLQKEYMKLLRHELKHIKDADDKLYQNASSMRRHNIGKYGLFSRDFIILGIAYFGVAGFVDKELAAFLNTSERVVEVSTQVGAAACGLVLMASTAAGLWGYAFHPAERSARKAEKLKTPDVVYISRFDGREKVPLLGRAL